MDADADGGGKAIERDLSTFSGYRNRIARRKMSAVAAATLSLESNTHLLAGSLARCPSFNISIIRSVEEDH